MECFKIIFAEIQNFDADNILFSMLLQNNQTFDNYVSFPLLVRVARDTQEIHLIGSVDYRPLWLDICNYMLLEPEVLSL